MKSAAEFPQLPAKFFSDRIMRPRQASPHAIVSYRASNWRYVEDTQARGVMGGVPANTPKMVFLYPLRRDWQAVLLGKPRPARRPRRRPAA